MPGKTKAKRGGVRGIDDGDSQSTTSTRSMYGSDNEDDYNEAPTNKTNSFIDALTEKRCRTFLLFQDALLVCQFLCLRLLAI
eukprot:2733564-Rhodomonas_salina.3